MAPLTREQLEAAHSWQADDEVPRRPAMTEFRRRLRYHQSTWRATHGHPIGTQPIVPRPGGGAVKTVGNRLPFEYARETGVNFVTAAALAAAKARTSRIERHQSFDHQRLWAELLWSPTMAFNLFGDLASDPLLADRAVHAWWPDTPGAVNDVRFAHSPGRLDAAYLGNLMAFEAPFALDLGDQRTGIVAVDVKYHERLERATPKPTRLPRYLEVAERSGAFEPGAYELVKKTNLLVMWLEHLLVLSMIQHATDPCSWGRYVVVHPAGNSDHAEACDRYRDLLTDRSSFASMSVEELLDSGVLPARTTTTLRQRYLPR